MNKILLGNSLKPSKELLDDLVAAKFASRLFESDATLWGKEAEAESAIRLGWVNVFERTPELLREAQELRTILHKGGASKIVLSGMGGSSLAPETITKNDDVSLTLLDSTHPQAVLEATSELEKTALVVSSKSGSTVETRSHLEAFEEAFKKTGIEASERIIVVTDPGSELERYANQHGYRTFLADPNVGGRYSALTAFGLVPSVLAGADCVKLVEDAQSAAKALREDSPNNPGLILGAALAAQLPEAYIFGVTAQKHAEGQVADWIEQLIAESTGKQQNGLLPLHLYSDEYWETVMTGGDTPQNMFLVDLNPLNKAETRFDRGISVWGSLGAQFMLWEVATVALSRLIGVNPFDQPDVKSAKSAARASLDKSLTSGEAPIVDKFVAEEIIPTLNNFAKKGHYIAIQAFLTADSKELLSSLSQILYEEFKIPVANGFGPRYLHSTGQFHKGGPRKGVFLQIVEKQMADVEIPSLNCGFDDLLLAQAQGDKEVLEALGMPVITIEKSVAEKLTRG